MSKNDDFFGGMFDFNGDGNTTWDEQWVAFKILEDIENEENEDGDVDEDDISYSHNYANPSPSVRAAQPQKNNLKPDAVKTSIGNPFVITNKSQYHKYLREKICEIGISVLILLGVLILACKIIGAIFEAAAENMNSCAGGLVILAFLGAAIYFGGIVIMAVGRNIIDDIKLVDIARKEYLENASEEELKKMPERKKNIIILLILIASVVLIASVISVLSCASDDKRQSETENLVPEEEYSEQQSDKNDREYYSVPAVPYVGMSESRIGDTGLGKPSGDVRHNTEVTWNETYIANLYDFYKDGERIFTARCVDGKVTEVWDWREFPESDYVPDYSFADDSDDPYNASDYRNAEDFYDDNYYDFFDYYDAEKYYNEHH